VNKSTCRDCAYLIEGDNGKWLCDGGDPIPIENITDCDVPTENTIKFEIFWEDLTEDCQKQLANVLKYIETEGPMVGPICVLEFEREDTE